MEQVVPQSKWKYCLGSAGTVVIADTASIFHRGKVPVVSDRLAVFLTTLPEDPKVPTIVNLLFL